MRKWHGRPERLRPALQEPPVRVHETPEGPTRWNSATGHCEGEGCRWILVKLQREPDQLTTRHAIRHRDLVQGLDETNGHVD